MVAAISIALFELILAPIAAVLSIADGIMAASHPMHVREVRLPIWAPAQSAGMPPFLKGIRLLDE